MTGTTSADTAASVASVDKAQQKQQQSTPTPSATPAVAAAASSQSASPTSLAADPKMPQPAGAPTALAPTTQQVAPAKEVEQCLDAIKNDTEDILNQTDDMVQTLVKSTEHGIEELQES